MIVKVCGVTRPDDARAALSAGADWLGLNLWPRSRRALDRDRARAVVEAARAERAGAALVGVFVNEGGDAVAEAADDLGLDYVQLHGDESPEDCARFGERAIKAVPLASPRDVAALAAYPCQTILVDTPSAGYGGSGRTGDWELARAAVETGRRILLAGGLTPENVAAAVAAVKPFGVDVASGVESAPGRKDVELLRRFVDAARGED